MGAGPAVYTGHTHLREKVLGEAQLGRPANLEEIREMGEILDAEMSQGRWACLPDWNMPAPIFPARQKWLNWQK